MKTKTVSAVIEASSTGFGAYVEDEALPLTGYGKNVQEAKEDLATSLNEMIEFYGVKGEALPDAYNAGNIEFEYKYDVASIFEHFGMLDATNFAKRIGMNASLLRQYKTGSAVAGKKAKEKIEAGLHALGRELLNVRL